MGDGSGDRGTVLSWGTVPVTGQGDGLVRGTVPVTGQGDGLVRGTVRDC